MLVLIEVERGVVVNVDSDEIDYLDYHVIDLDAKQVGEPLDELPPEFVKQWPDVAKEIVDYNSTLESE